MLGTGPADRDELFRDSLACSMQANRCVIRARLSGLSERFDGHAAKVYLFDGFADSSLRSRITSPMHAHAVSAKSNSKLTGSSVVYVSCALVCAEPSVMIRYRVAKDAIEPGHGLSCSRISEPCSIRFDICRLKQVFRHCLVFDSGSEEAQELRMVSHHPVYHLGRLGCRGFTVTNLHCTSTSL